MRRFFRGFRFAWRGIRQCVRTERNFRFHLVIAAYVLGFAPAFSLSRAEGGVLILTIGAVLCAEAFNTAIEHTVDLACDTEHPLAAKAKDIAAGAVLLTAVTAIAVGLLLFLRVEVWRMLFAHWRTHLWKPILIALTAVPAGLFVFKDTRKE